MGDANHSGMRGPFANCFRTPRTRNHRGVHDPRGGERDEGDSLAQPKTRATDALLNPSICIPTLSNLMAHVDETASPNNPIEWRADALWLSRFFSHIAQCKSDKEAHAVLRK